MKHLLIGFIRAWRFAISPLYGQVCRYHPSCSAYALEAVTVHGSVRGTWLSVRRIARCHPWAEGGIDDIPEARHDHFAISRFGFAVPVGATLSHGKG